METLAAFLLYFSILLAVGLYFHRRQTSSSEFIMGNRSLNFWLTAFSAHASDMSAWLFMAFPSAVFIGGLPQAWAAVGLILGMFFNWHLVAEPLRVQTEKYQSYTLPTYFENRFSDTWGILRILTAIMTVLFLTWYLAAGLMAMGFLFESVFSLDYYFGLSISTVVAVTYMLFGGYVTVAWVDLFQALFLLAMLILVPVMTFSTLQEPLIPLNIVGDASISSLILLSLGWGLGYFGQPHILTKFMGIKDPENMYKSKYVGMSWLIIALAFATFVGLVGQTYFKSGLANPELVYVEMVKALYQPFVAGFILCAILAANMSTMDSQILVCASVISEDFYKHLVRKKATEAELLKVSRYAVVLVSLVALFIAFRRQSTILETVLYAWSGLGASFGPIILMGLYSRNVNKYGAMAGIVVGGLLAGFWQLFDPYKIPALVPAFFLSLMSIFVISFLTKEKKW